MPDEMLQGGDHPRAYVLCERCNGTGAYDHDCGEDVCCCADPQENVACDLCGGTGCTLGYAIEEASDGE